MSFMVAATIGSALLSANSSRKATKAAEKASDQAAASAKAALDFSKEQYQDWKDVYGDFQTNLGDYYSNLTPEDRNLWAGRDVAAEIRGETAQGLEIFEKEKNRALEQVRETLDQRGIGTSGLAAETEAQFGGFGAVERSKIRREGTMRTREEEQLQRQGAIEADKQVAGEKSDFLRAGLGLDAAGTVQSSFNAQANNDSRIATGAARGAGTAAQASTTATGAAFTSVAEYLDNRPKNKAPISTSQAI